MLVTCKKCKKGIIIKLIGDNMMTFVKRQQDYNPVRLNVYGKDYNITANCTLCGEPQFIEVVNGKIIKDNLDLKEEKPNDGQEQEPKTTEENPAGANSASGTNNHDTGHDKPGANSGSPAGNPGTVQPVVEPAPAA